MTKRYIEFLNSVLYRNRQLWQPPWLRPSASRERCPGLQPARRFLWFSAIWSEVQKLGFLDNNHLLIDYALLGSSVRLGGYRNDTISFVSTVGEALLKEVYVYRN